jgi:hypothetical protein
MKRSLLSVALLFLTAAFATAAVRPLYRIDLRNGESVLSMDRPVHRGTIFLFHSYPKGGLTGLPEESVIAIEPRTRAAADEMTVVAPPVLQPGEVIFLPPLAGDGGATAAAGPAPSGDPSIPGGVYDPRNPAFGYSSPRTRGQQTLDSLTGAVVPGDLGRAISVPPPTAEPPLGSNGFPVTPGTQALAIGPDGQPILVPAGVPGSTPPQIGPNGTPVMAPAGAPGSTPPTIGPNGTPVLAPPGTPGSAPPPVGPNGYPATSPPGR